MLQVKNKHYNLTSLISRQVLSLFVLFHSDEWEVPDFPPMKQYPIKKYKHLGRCVIINNEKFYESADRKGTDVSMITVVWFKMYLHEATATVIMTAKTWV